MTDKKKEMIEEFENMGDMAELKALSEFSLEKPLSPEQYERMMDLAKKVGLK